MGTVTLTLEEYNALIRAAGMAMTPMPSMMMGSAVSSPSEAPSKPRRRRVSKYARAYGAAYKALKKKHPRSKHATLVKRAHAEARRKTKK